MWVLDVLVVPLGPAGPNHLPAEQPALSEGATESTVFEIRLSDVVQRCSYRRSSMRTRKHAASVDESGSKYVVPET